MFIACRVGSAVPSREREKTSEILTRVNALYKHFTIMLHYNYLIWCYKGLPTNVTITVGNVQLLEYIKTAFCALRYSAALYQCFVQCKDRCGEIRFMDIQSINHDCCQQTKCFYYHKLKRLQTISCLNIANH